MHLQQTTLFGVRGERFRIKKSAPIARAGKTPDAERPTHNAQVERAETMWWKCLDCGHKWRDLRECKGVCRSGCPACRSRNIMDCNIGSAGEAPHGATTNVEPNAQMVTAEDACAGCLKVGVANCLACIERDGGTPNAERPTPNAERGEATGCGLMALLVLAAAILAAALMIERRGVRVQVSWLQEYPDPVCERCGKVLDGAHNECVEEGAR